MANLPSLPEICRKEMEAKAEEILEQHRPKFGDDVDKLKQQARDEKRKNDAALIH